MEKRIVLRKLKNCPTGAEVRYPWANDWLTVIDPKRMGGLVLCRDRYGRRYSEDGNDRVYLDLETAPETLKKCGATGETTPAFVRPPRPP